MEIQSSESILKYYGSVRARTLAVAAVIPEDRLEESPGEGRFSAADLVRHIAASERWMWGENVQGRPSRYPGHGRELAEGKAAVLDYLDRMQDEAAEIIASLTSERLEEKCRTVGGVDMRIWKWLRLMIEHEIHHRGQLYQVLGEMAVPAPSLYGLTEPEVRARSEPLP